MIVVDAMQRSTILEEVEAPDPTVKKMSKTQMTVGFSMVHLHMLA